MGCVEGVFSVNIMKDVYVGVFCRKRRKRALKWLKRNSDYSGYSYDCFGFGSGIGYAYAYAYGYGYDEADSVLK